MSYTLNAEQARAGDSNSQRITETGAYVGTFVRAEAALSRQSTQGIEFTFEANDKTSADFLTLWTVNATGEQIYGYKQLMALMTCLRVKTINEAKGQVEKYVDGQRSKVTATVFPDLMNKPIGVLLQKEEYQKNNGDIGTKFNFAGFFDPQTRMTATEILDKAGKAERLDKMIAALKDKPMQKRAANTGSYAGEPAPTGGSNDFDDSDIPF